jgi:hypothetical protein
MPRSRVDVDRVFNLIGASSAGAERADRSWGVVLMKETSREDSRGMTSFRDLHCREDAG